MKTAKQIAGYFLLAITALPVFAFVIFVAQRQYLQWQMEEKLEEESLTTIILHSRDFKWYKKGKEIIANGHMFDVKDIKKLPNDQLLITGLYDYQEQKLHQNISKMFDKKSNSRMQQLIQQMLALIATEPIHNQYTTSLNFVDFSSTAFYNDGLTSCYFPIIIPPPKAS